MFHPQNRPSRRIAPNPTPRRLSFILLSAFSVPSIRGSVFPFLPPEHRLHASIFPYSPPGPLHNPIFLFSLRTPETLPFSVTAVRFSAFRMISYPSADSLSASPAKDVSVLRILRSGRPLSDRVPDSLARPYWFSLKPLVLRALRSVPVV